MRGGDCGGSSQPQLCQQQLVISFGLRVTAKHQFASSLVGKCTSSIWMAANCSDRERGVRPGASGRRQARKLTCRQQARNETKMCASMRCSDEWKIGRRLKSSLSSLKAAATCVS